MKCPSCDADNDAAAEVCFTCGKALRKDPSARFATAPGPGDAAAREERRSETRIETPLNVILTRLDDAGLVVQEERTIVDNISSRGARVMTSMSGVAVGEMFEIEEMGGDFKARASVRDAHTGSDKIPRLGLRFEGGRAPARLVQTDDERHVTHTMRAVKLPSPRPETPLRPAARSATPREKPGEERRTSTRIESPLEVRIKRLAPDGAVVQEERTLAENISQGGIRVMTSMEHAVADEVMLVEEFHGDFAARATIRHVYVGGDRIRRLNLQFLDAKAPDRLAPPDDLRAATMSFKAVSASVAPEPEPLARAAEPASAEDDAQREELLAAHARLKTRTHFEVLGLPRASSADDVKAVYVALARRYHPDAGLGARLAELRSEINAIFIRLGEAYQVLSDPALRAEYEARLGPSKERHVPRAAAAPAESKSPASAPRVARATPRSNGDSAATTSGGGAEAAAPRPEPPRRPLDTAEMQLERAEQALATALGFMRAEKYWDAIQAVERGLKDVEDSPSVKRRLKITLAQATRRNPKWLKRAEGILQEIIADNPSDLQAHYELALLYSDSGLASRGQRALRRVLELDPDHAGARAALQPDATSATKRFGLLTERLDAAISRRARSRR